MPKNLLLRKRRSKDDSQEFSEVANYFFRSLFIYQLSWWLGHIFLICKKEGRSMIVGLECCQL